MKDPEKELIEEIVNLFKDYEETYVPGEWEAFAQQHAARRVPFRYWMQIAAVFFMILSVFPFAVNDLFHTGAVRLSTAKQGSGGRSVRVPAENRALPTAGARLNKGLSYAVSGGPAQPLSLMDTPIVQKRAQDQVAAHSSAGLQEQLYAKVASPATQALAAAGDTAVGQKKRILSTADFLAGESKNKTAYAEKTRSGSKWDFGLAVIPSATGSNVDVGAGLTTAYRISDKLAISSGVSLLQLQSGKNVSPAADDGVSLLSISDKSLLAVNTNIKAIDVPIGIVYQVNQHFFTSAGVSFLNIISDKQSSTFTQTSQVSMMATSPSGAAFSYKTVQTSQVNELTPDGTLRGSSYLGFFNFSVGRKQNIFGNYRIQVEPFIKVPIGKLSTEDLRLMNSGVKFQFSF